MRQADTHLYLFLNYSIVTVRQSKFTKLCSNTDCFGHFKFAVFRFIVHSAHLFHIRSELRHVMFMYVYGKRSARQTINNMRHLIFKKIMLNYRVLNDKERNYESRTVCC